MTPASLALSADHAVRRVQAFMDGFSLEATRPKPADFETLGNIAPAGTALYLSAVPNRPQQDLIGYCAQAAAIGLIPVPHIAARNFARADELSDLLMRMSKAGVRRALVIAGDHDRPAGPFADALAVITSGLLQRHGIVEIGISGYPDGHGRIAPDAIEKARADKIATAAHAGIKVHIVTQFCFDPAAILAWVGRLRASGVTLPVRIGMAGPASLASLMRYAHRCGVRASASGLTRQSGLLRNVLGTSAPDGIIHALAEASSEALGDIAPHIYSFGGIGATARWAAAVKAGRFKLDGREGFSVDAS